MIGRLFKLGLLFFAGLAGVITLWRKLPSNAAVQREIPLIVTQAKPARRTLKQRLWTIGLSFALFMVLLGIGGFLVAASGVMPIKASSGHWPITRWFLSFSMRRSIATHTIGKESPSIDSPLLVVKGAGHYETGCAPCHGSPELRHPRIAGEMTPHPPYLPPEIPNWDNAELFYVIKHGVKFTGMPAWPAQKRDDEVWAMVAFLRQLPNLSLAEYRQLTGAEEEAAASMESLESTHSDLMAAVKSCQRCHGASGRGRGLGAFPKLAGQSPNYLYASLAAFARGDRFSGMMEPVAAELTDQQMRELALMFSRQEQPPPAAPTVDADRIERGRQIALQGVPSQRLPACVDCHGPGTLPRNPVYPSLAGQYPEYLVLQLELFKNKQRGGTAYHRLMHFVASHLTPEQMQDVAQYYSSLQKNDGE